MRLTVDPLSLDFKFVYIDVLQFGIEARELLRKLLTLFTFDTVLHDPKAIAVEHGNYSLFVVYLISNRHHVCTNNYY